MPEVTINWTPELMKSVCKRLLTKKDITWDHNELFAVRFDTEGDLALVHRQRTDRYGKYDPNGEWRYTITWMYPEWKNGRPVLSKDVITDWQDCGQSPWYGDEDEYQKDKADMETEGKIYMNIEEE